MAMNRLTRVLMVLLRAAGWAQATKIEQHSLPAAWSEGEPMPVETPPPNNDQLSPEERAYFAQRSSPPIESYNLQPTFNLELYGIYSAVPHPKAFIQDSAVHIGLVNAETIIAAGGKIELRMFWDWAAHTSVKNYLNRRNVIYSLYKIADANVLDICSFGEKLERYYCTRLDLPPDKFTLLEWMRHSHEPQELKLTRQYSLDHSRKGQ